MIYRKHMTNVCNVSYKHTRPPYFPDGRYKSGVDKGKYGKGGRGTEYVWNVCKKKTGAGRLRIARRSPRDDQIKRRRIAVWITNN